MTNTVSVSLISTGTERSSISVGITGNTKNDKQVVMSKKGIEILNGVAEVGKTFNAPAEKVEESLITRLKGLPNGEDIFNYLKTYNYSITDYVSSAISALSATKLKEPTGRAKRGKGFAAKQLKITIANLAKLTCLFVETDSTNSITDQSLSTAFTKLLETIKELDEDTVVAAASAIVKKHGIDSQGHVKFRGSAETDADTDSSEED